MSITAYVGIPGSGKSYEVVSSVIVEHFKQGRRIVTNIEGLNESALISFCLEDKSLKFEDLGQIIHVTDEQCQQDDFFPYKGSENTICKAGDLICLDEVWRIFPKEQIHKNHRSFIAEHRHFTDPETGHCCDLVVINQAISSIPRFIKERVETTYLMSKLLALGMPKRYRVNVYGGAKTTKNALIAQYQNKYNPKVFELYSSFDTKNGKQVQIDDRQNFFKSFKFKLIVISIITCVFLSVYYINKVMNGVNSSSSKPVQEVEKKQRSNTFVKSFDEKVKNTTSAEVKENAIKQSKVWRISGELIRDGQAFVILIDLRGNFRFEHASKFNGSGRGLSGILDGEFVSYYTGRGDILNEKFIFADN